MRPAREFEGKRLSLEVDPRTRVRLRIRGVVQGVGFRPYVYRLAQETRLGGFVGNDSEGVFLEAEGERGAVEEFCHRLEKEAPPASAVEWVGREERSPRGEVVFRIVESEWHDSPRVFVSPDLDCCVDCLREIRNPGDRRFRYPFTNCTNCGPRYTIIRALPYDRPSTTMARFHMCESCQKEYHDPEDRRFHAQPNACPECGPGLSMPLDQIVSALLGGEVVALKGVGGYHLACDATNSDTVSRLRWGKRRLAKPFAVMVANLEEARRLAHISPEEGEMLRHRAKPIVLLKSRSSLPETVTPGLSSIGLMLPYTPFHHLLFDDGRLRALVMTSGNESGLPIASTEKEAEEQLRDLAQKFVHHDRDIEIPCDDSVVRVFQGACLPIRRSRGYAPFPVKLPFEVPDILATGGQMKATLCLGRERDAFLSQHLGDLENLETLEFFRRISSHLQGLYRFSPHLLVADKHPGYLSSRWARAAELPLVEVQHHHAHLASCMVEHGLGPEKRALGLILDGTGYGDDGTVWGGEVLRGGYGHFERLAWLKPVPLPGGDSAVREPWRMALSHLWASGAAWDTELPPVRQAVTAGASLSPLQSQLERGINSVATSSVGRLFDAVASLLDLAHRVEYEAQAAILLENIADTKERGRYDFGPDLDASPVIRSIVRDVRRAVSPGEISMRFHRGLARAFADSALEHHQGLPVVLSGGVFQNVLLLGLVKAALEERAVCVLTHRIVPPNDGGLALGQLAVGAVLYQQEGETICA